MTPELFLNKWIVYHPNFPEELPVKFGICEKAKWLPHQGTVPNIKLRVRCQQTGTFDDITTLDHRPYDANNIIDRDIRVTEIYLRNGYQPKDEFQQLVKERLENNANTSRPEKLPPTPCRRGTVKSGG